MAYRENPIDLNQLAVRSTRARGSAQGYQLSASLPGALSKAAYNSSEAPRLRNSMNNADLLKSDKVGSFHGGVQVRKSPSAHSYARRDSAGAQKQPRTATSHASHEARAKADDESAKSPGPCHSNLVTDGSKTGGGKGKSQLTLYINSRPPNGECETAHEASIEEERSGLASQQQNWRSGEHLVDPADAAGSGTEVADPARSANVDDRRKGTRSDDDAAHSLGRGTVEASDHEAGGSPTGKGALTLEPLHTKIAEPGRDELETILREAPGSDRDCQVTSGRFSDLHQTYFLVEEDPSDPSVPEADSLGNLQQLTRASRQSRGYKTKAGSSKHSKAGERTHSEAPAQAKAPNPFGERDPSVHTMLTGSSQVKELSVRQAVAGMHLCIHRRGNLPHGPKKHAPEKEKAWRELKPTVKQQLNLTQQPAEAVLRETPRLKVTLGALPRRKQLTANPHANGRDKRGPYAPRRPAVKAKATKRSMEGSSLQPIRSGEPQGDNGYPPNEYAANSYYRLINEFADQSLAGQDHKPRGRRQKSCHQGALDPAQRDSAAASKTTTGAFGTARELGSTALLAPSVAGPAQEAADDTQHRAIQILLQQPGPEQKSSKKHSRLSSAQGRHNRDLSGMVSHVDQLAPMYDPGSQGAPEDAEVYAILEPPPALPQATLRRTIPSAMKGYLTSHISHIPRFTQKEIDDRKTAIKLPNRGTIVKVVVRDNRRVSEPYERGMPGFDGTYYSNEAEHSDGALLEPNKGSFAHSTNNEGRQIRRASTNNSLHHELTPQFKDGVYRFGHDSVPAIHGGTLQSNDILSVQQIKLQASSPGKRSITDSKTGLSVEAETPLTNPKITTEVYLSKVRMLSPSKKAYGVRRGPALGVEGVSPVLSGHGFSKKLLASKSGKISEANEVQTVSKSSDQPFSDLMKQNSHAHMRAALGSSQTKHGMLSGQSSTGNFGASVANQMIEIQESRLSGLLRDRMNTATHAKPVKESFSSQRPSSIETGKRQTDDPAKTAKCETQPSVTGQQQNQVLSTLPMRESQTLNLSQYANEGRRAGQTKEAEQGDLKGPAQLPGIASEELLVQHGSPEGLASSPTLTNKREKKWTSSEQHHTFDGRVPGNVARPDGSAKARIKSATAAAGNQELVKTSWQTAGQFPNAKQKLEAASPTQELVMERRSYSSEGIANTCKGKSRESFPGSFGAMKKKTVPAEILDWEEAKPLDVHGTGRAHSSSSLRLRGAKDCLQSRKTSKAKDFSLNDKADRFGVYVETTELTPAEALRATLGSGPGSGLLKNRVLTEEQSVHQSRENPFTFDQAKMVPKVDSIIKVMTSQRRNTSLEATPDRKASAISKSKSRYDQSNTGTFKRASNCRPGANTTIDHGNSSSQKPSQGKSGGKNYSGQFDIAGRTPPRNNSPELFRKHPLLKQQPVSRFSQGSEVRTLQVQRPQPKQLARLGAGSIQEVAQTIPLMNDLLVVKQYESSEERRLPSDDQKSDPISATLTSDLRLHPVKRSEMNIQERKMAATAPQSRAVNDTTFLARMKAMEDKRQHKLSMLRRERPQTVQTNYITDPTLATFDKTQQQTVSDYADLQPIYSSFLNRHERLRLKERNSQNDSISSIRIMTKKASEVSVKDRLEVKRDIKQACRRSIAQIRKRLQLACQKPQQLECKDALIQTRDQKEGNSLISVGPDFTELDIHIDSVEKPAAFVPQAKKDTSSAESLAGPVRPSRKKKDPSRQKMKQTTHMIKLQPKPQRQRPETSVAGGKARGRYLSSNAHMNVPFGRPSAHTSQRYSRESALPHQSGFLETEEAYSIDSFPKAIRKPKPYHPIRQVGRVGDSASVYAEKASVNEYTSLRKKEKDYFSTSSVASDQPLRNLVQQTFR